MSVVIPQWQQFVTAKSNICVSGSSMTGGNSEVSNILSSEVGSGDLKIVFEKQGSSSNMELERITPTPEVPTKRSR